MRLPVALRAGAGNALGDCALDGLATLQATPVVVRAAVVARLDAVLRECPALHVLLERVAPGLVAVVAEHDVEEMFVVRVGDIRDDRLLVAAPAATFFRE